MRKVSIGVQAFDTIRELQGTYPVIALSFANVKEKNFINAREAVVQVISGVFQRFRDRWERDTDREKARYSFMDISPESSDVAIQNSIHDLSSYLEYRYKKSV